MPNHKPKKSLPNPGTYFAEENLRYIWKLFTKSDKNTAGTDGITLEIFNKNIDQNISSISKKLNEGKYAFKRLKNYRKRKSNGKYRNICVPTVKDRLVQRLVLCLLTEPEDKLNILNDVSFGSMKGRGTHEAIAKAVVLRNKYPWALKTDITAFFDKIDREDLINLLQMKLEDKILLPLLQQVINCEIDIAHKNHNDRKQLEQDGILTGKGLRQGMPLSPLLSNVFLSSFDKIVIEKHLNIIRYVDDIIVFCSSEEECHEQKELIETELKKTKLTIPSLKGANSKTRIAGPREAIEFLGVEIYRIKNGEYRSKIPQYKFDEASSELNGYTNYQFVFKEKGFTYADLERKLNNKRVGHKAAYKNTNNLKEFICRFDKKAKKIKTKLLEEVLGAEVFASLNDEKRKFLGISESSPNTEGNIKARS